MGVQTDDVDEPFYARQSQLESQADDPEDLEGEVEDTTWWGDASYLPVSLGGPAPRRFLTNLSA